MWNLEEKIRIFVMLNNKKLKILHKLIADIWLWQCSDSVVLKMFGHEVFSVISLYSNQTFESNLYI